MSECELNARSMPATGADWAALSEAYASLIEEHLSSESRWLDAGCGARILEEDLEPLEDWLVHLSRVTIGMDIQVTKHLNIHTLVCGSIYDLPFADDSFDLVTCNMVMEHLGEPETAISEITRVLAPNGALIINTPNLWNYGVFANAVLSKVLPERWRLRLVRASDDREAKDIFPVRYRANTLARLIRLLSAGGLTVHKHFQLAQRRPFFVSTASLESFLVNLTPGVRLLICAHKKAPF
jgi:SAM-dependent methyltransferase